MYDVSVIIPTYNRRNHILDAIESARQQRDLSIEIIVVDDGSTDDTEQLLEGMQGVSYFSQVNQGPGAARNLGLKHARGKFIASLDSDDVWQSDFASECIKAIESNNIDAVYCNWNRIIDGKSVPSDMDRNSAILEEASEDHGTWKVHTAEALDSFLKLCPCSNSGFLFKRQLIDRFEWPTKTIIADDWYLYIQMLTMHARFGFTFRKLWEKREIGDNILDGTNPIHALEKLYVHDVGIMLKDFGQRLNSAQKFALSMHMARGRWGLLKRYLSSNFQPASAIRQATQLCRTPKAATAALYNYLFPPGSQ